MLHIIRGTAMEPLFISGQYRPMSLEEYVRLVCCQLELLPPETVIERLTGDGDKKTLLAPDWTRDKIRVLGGIDQTLARWNSWQGRFFSAPEARIRDFLRAPLLPSLNPSGCSVGAPAFSFRKRPPPPLYKRIFPMLYWQTARKGSDSACIKDLC